MEAEIRIRLNLNCNIDIVMPNNSISTFVNVAASTVVHRFQSAANVVATLTREIGTSTFESDNLFGITSCNAQLQVTHRFVHP